MHETAAERYEREYKQKNSSFDQNPFKLTKSYRKKKEKAVTNENIFQINQNENVYVKN